MLDQKPEPAPRRQIAGCVVALVAWIAAPLPAQAALSSSQLAQATLAPRADAQLPLQIRMSDLNERSAPLQSGQGFSAHRDRLRSQGYRRPPVVQARDTVARQLPSQIRRIA